MFYLMCPLYFITLSSVLGWIKFLLILFRTLCKIEVYCKLTHPNPTRNTLLCVFVYVLLQTFDFTLIPIQFYAITLLVMWCDFIRVFQHFLQAVELPKKRSSKVTRTRDLIHGRSECAMESDTRSDSTNNVAK